MEFLEKVINQLKKKSLRNPSIKFPNESLVDFRKKSIDKFNAETAERISECIPEAICGHTCKEIPVAILKKTPR